MADEGYNRLSTYRSQQGWHATLPPFAAGVGPTALRQSTQLADVTPTRPSRIAVSFDSVTAMALTGVAMQVDIESRVDEGIFRRAMRIYGQGLCFALPQGRTVVKIWHTASHVVPWQVYTIVGEGIVNTEWQGESTTIPALGKQALSPVPFARRYRVTPVTGGPFQVGSSGLISILPAPGGQTIFEGAATNGFDVTNLAALDSQFSVEWEVVA